MMVLEPADITELRQMVGRYPSARVLGGGTLLVPELRERGALRVTSAASPLVDLRGVDACKGLTAATIGSMVSLAEIAVAEPSVPMLIQAASSVGGPALRSGATVGGNVAASAPGCLAVALLAAGADVMVLDRHRNAVVTRPIADVIRDPTVVILRFELTHAIEFGGFAKVRQIRIAGVLVSCAAAIITGGLRVAVGGFVAPRLLNAVEIDAIRAPRSIRSPALADADPYVSSVVAVLVRRLVGSEL